MRPSVQEPLDPPPTQVRRIEPLDELSETVACPLMDWNEIRSNREAFDHLVQPLAPLVAGVIRRELGVALAEKTEVDDLLQETWMKAFRSIESFRGREIEEFRAWLLRIAVRTVQDAGRRHGRVGRGKGEVPLERNPVESGERGPAPGELLAGSDPTPSRILRREERYQRFREALSNLSEDHRTVIELVRLDGLPVQEAARRMGRSRNATSMLLLRALLQLKQHFGTTESLHLPTDPQPDFDSSPDEENR